MKTEEFLAHFLGDWDFSDPDVVKLLSDVQDLGDTKNCEDSTNARIKRLEQAVADKFVFGENSEPEDFRSLVSEEDYQDMVEQTKDIMDEYHLSWILPYPQMKNKRRNEGFE